MEVYLPGSYNHWNADDVSVKAEADGKNRFVVSRYLTKGLYRFKVAADGGWLKNWGGINTGRLVAPVHGTCSFRGRHHPQRTGKWHLHGPGGFLQTALPGRC